MKAKFQNFKFAMNIKNLKEFYQGIRFESYIYNVCIRYISRIYVFVAQICAILNHINDVS